HRGRGTREPEKDEPSHASALHCTPCGRGRPFIGFRPRLRGDVVPGQQASVSRSCRATGRVSTEDEELTMRRSNAKRLLLAGLLALAAAGVSSAQASAATLTVCPSGCA